MGRRTSAAPALMVALSVVGASGCAAQSCPAVYLNDGVHVDASAWADSGTTKSLAATVCANDHCVQATTLSKANPYDVFAGVSLPSGKATVRVRLAAGGRTLDRTTTVEVALTHPFGSGCGGRNEVDLAVTKSGALTPGTPTPVS